MALQVQGFADGSCVAHGITFNQNFCKLRISAWFDKEGRVTAVAAYDSLHRERPVPEKVHKIIGCEYGYVSAALRAQNAKEAALRGDA